ncbi:secG, partial [Symbiodinium microadriaticum]
MDDDGLVLYAVFEEDEAELRAAHAEGVALQAADARGWTPVLHAAFAGKVQSLRILIELLGLAALDARTPDGSSATHLAATEGHAECLEALAALGGDLKAPDSSGWTAVHAAAAAGQIRSCEVLSGLGLDLSCKTPEGWTPAHCAAMSGASASMRTLRDLGAKLDEVDLEGETPAHKAAAAGHEECLRELYQLGAPLNAVDQNGRTPAHFAAADGELACLRCLHELGVRLDTEDAMGESPLDKADIEEQAECVQFLQDLLNLERACAQKANDTLFVEEGGLLGVEREVEFEPPEDTSEPALDLELDDVTAVALAPLGGDLLQGFPVTLGWKK